MNLVEALEYTMESRGLTTPVDLIPYSQLVYVIIAVSRAFKVNNLIMQAG